MLNNSNAVMANAPDIKVGEVEQELSRLITQRETLHKQHEDLENRLRGVLAERKDASVGGASAPESVRVPLAEALHAEVVALSRLSDLLQSTINRIEL